MLECLIMGDSIAYGLHQVKPECVWYAKSGINSRNWVNQNITRSPYRARSVIVSLGSNDYRGIKTEEELQTVRRLTEAEHVYWILPAIKPDIQAIVKKVAAEHGDTVVPIRILSSDGVHPTYNGYKQLAKDTVPEMEKKQ